MKGLTFPTLVGLFLMSLGIITMIGWIEHIPSLVSTAPNYSLLWFNTSLGFFIVGLGLFLPDVFPRLKSAVLLILGITLTIFAGLSLSQDIFNYSLGIDQLFNKPWLDFSAPHPGRMADNNSVSFLLTGLTFVLMSRYQKTGFSILIQLFVFGVFIVGMSALLGYFFELKYLYSWYPGAHMSLYAAIGNTIMGLGLWSLMNRDSSYDLVAMNKVDRKIILLGGISVACVALLTCLIIFAICKNTAIPATAEHEKAYLVLLLGLAMGIFMMYWEVLPLVRRVIYSEKNALAANKLLKESEERFRSAFEFAATGMALISFEGHYLRVNQSLCQILGYSEAELLDIDSHKLMNLEDLEKEKPFLRQLLEGEVKTYELEQRFFNKNGELIWVRVNTSLIHDETGHPLYCISQLQNINAEKKAEEQLQLMAFHDPLTGVANRNKLEQYLHHLISTAQQNQPGFAVIMIDLDKFKKINDSIGHEAGDILLQVVAERLKTTVRATDLVARLGGDEFVIVLTNIKMLEVVAVVAQKILHNILKPIVIRGHEIFTSTSIGISYFPNDGQDIQTLMRNADLALYRAKEQGRNNYQFCTPEMTKNANEKILRQNALNEGMLKDEFILYYQPVMDLQTNKINGIEALLRWRNKEYGSVSTGEIISLCEESGLIIALSEWIIRSACKQVKIWHELGYRPLTVAVNLSPRQFKQANFVKSIVNILQDLTFPPHCLELEITESLIMQDPENTLKILQEFKKVGINISIDDFGTGYSSLSYLKRFSVDKIKIDNSLIRQVPKDETSISIVTAMIAMANKLGIRTIAEGIETPEQYEFLLEEGCSEMQGYYLSRPMPVDLMGEYLAHCEKGAIMSQDSKDSEEIESEP